MAQIEVAAKRVGIDLRPLLDPLPHNTHRFLALPAMSLKESLRSAGVGLPEELFLELPGRFATSGVFLDEFAAKQGVAESPW